MTTASTGAAMPSPAPAATPLSTIPIAAWWVLFLMTMDSVLGMIDRNAVAVLKPQLKEYFNVTDAGYGILVTAFLVPYALFYVLCGRWVDKYGSRVTLTLFVTIWSGATVASGFVERFEHLVILRAVLGAAEAGLLPASMLALVTWFPRDRLATIYAIKNPLQALGPILTPPIVAFLAISYGWRAAFWVPGAMGIAFGIAWWFADRNPPDYSKGAPPVKAAPTETFMMLLRNPLLWGVLLFRLVSDPVWFFFQQWQAGYLQEVLGMTLKDVGQLLWIPPAVNAVTTFISAYASDRMVRRGEPGVQSRLKVMYATLAFAPLIVLLPFVSGTLPVMIILTTTYIMSYTWLYLSNIMIADLFPKTSVGSAIGLVNCVGTIGAAAFNAAVGPAIIAFGYAPIFFACALLHPLAAVIAWRFYGKTGTARRNAAMKTI